MRSRMALTLPHDRHARRKAIALFVFCGLPGVALFAVAAAGTWIALVGDMNAQGTLILSLFVAGFGIPGLFLMLVGAGKWRHWRYGLAFAPILFILPIMDFILDFWHVHPFLLFGLVATVTFMICLLVKSVYCERISRNERPPQPEQSWH